MRAGHTAPSVPALRGLMCGRTGSAPRAPHICSREFSTAPSPEERPPFAGQPISSTHPELLAPGQLTPGVTAAEYAARRRQLSELLPPGSIAVLPSAATTYMAGVIPWPYRQVRGLGGRRWGLAGRRAGEGLSGGGVAGWKGRGG